MKASATKTGRSVKKKVEEPEAAPVEAIAEEAPAEGEVTDEAGDGPETAEAPQAAPGGAERVVKRRRKRGDGVRERVLTSALYCFSTFGFEGTSTREVALRADVTHTLVLYHFQSKEQLWYSAFEHALTPYLTAMAPIVEAGEGQSAAEALSKYIEVFVRQAARWPEIFRIISNEGNAPSERLDWLFSHFLRENFKVVCDLIRRGQAEGTVRQCDPARLYYTIGMIGGTLPTLAIEYKELTGRSFESDPEILRNIAFIYELVFV